MSFNALDRASWPDIMTADEIAVIYRQSSVSALKKACQRGVFQPAPYQKQPYRWRKAEVLRDLEGGFQSMRRRA